MKKMMMELKSTISDTWKLCTFGSLAGCLVILLFLNRSYDPGFRNVTMVGSPPFVELHSDPKPQSEPKPEPEPLNSTDITTEVLEPESVNSTTIPKTLKSKPEQEPLNSTITKVLESKPEDEPEPEPELEYKPVYSTINPKVLKSKPKSEPKPEPEPINSTIITNVLNSKPKSESEPELEPKYSTIITKVLESKPEYDNEPLNSTITKVLKSKPNTESKPESEPINSTIITKILESESESEPVNSTIITKNPESKPEPETLNSTITKVLESRPDPLNPREKEAVNKRGGTKCNMFEGRWVYKEDEVPTYNTTVCPFLEEKMSCRKNGRPDSGYEKWIWEPTHCDIPLFNGRDMLERLRNKRMIVVGDSLNRNQWESLACLIYTSVHPSRVEVDAQGSLYKFLIAKDYNFKLEFYWSPFLIELDGKHKSGKRVLVLDKMTPSSQQWRGADVMLFNSGHWWTHHGKNNPFNRWDFFEYKGEIYEEMQIELAYELAMQTWANWLHTNVKPNKTTVFFRSISAEHKGKQWCYESTRPILDGSYQLHYPKSLIEIVENQIQQINKKVAGQVVVKYLNITELSGHRRDAHPSVYRSWRWKIYTKKYKRLIPDYADCSHWCLPGLPDTWNRLLYVSLLLDGHNHMSIT